MGFGRLEAQRAKRAIDRDPKVVGGSKDLDYFVNSPSTSEAIENFTLQAWLKNMS